MTELAKAGDLVSTVPPAALCAHRPPGEVEDRWAHGDGGADPHVCGCCGAPVSSDLWTDGLCLVCRVGQPVKDGAGHLARLARDLATHGVKEEEVMTRRRSKAQSVPVVIARWSLSGRATARGEVEPIQKILPARPHCAACGQPTLPGLLAGGECPPCAFLRKAAGGRGA